MATLKWIASAISLTALPEAIKRRTSNSRSERASWAARPAFGLVRSNASFFSQGGTHIATTRKHFVYQTL